MKSTGQGMGKDVENTEDVPDALGSNPTSASTSSNGTSSSDFASRKYKPKMDTCRPGAEYNMKHKHRGKAIIFNHEFFENDRLTPREGTQKDGTDLQRVLTKLGFDVEVHPNLKYDKIKSTAETVANQDHKDNDCLLVVILSHGITGSIFAKDKGYKLDSIWSLFTTQKCPSLAGKPKLFFVQACQGSGLDNGITMPQIEYDSAQTSDNNIPLHPDFLIAYSTVLGFKAWRSKKGSWFIQALCDELEANGTRLDILTLLTFVNHRVALDYETKTKNPETNKKKMMPNFMSMLTRILIFSEKPSIGVEQVP